MVKHSFAKRFHNKQLHAWHFGFVVAVFNGILAAVLACITLAVVTILPIWIYVLLIAPLFFAFFWLWLTQQFLHVHRRFSVHESLLIAKLGSVPFMLLFCLAVVGYVAVEYGLLGSEASGIFFYELLVSSVGSIFLGITVIVFGLRHHFREYFA